MLTDLMLPGLDGLGLARALRAGPRIGRIPIVLTSAVWGCGEEKADAFLRKPFDFAALEATVARMLAAPDG